MQNVPLLLSAASPSVRMIARGGLAFAMGAVAAALFSVNGLGTAAAWVTRVTAAGSVSIEPAFALNAQGSFSPAPMSMGSATDKVYLSFYATGVQAAGMANVSVLVNGLNCPVLYAGNGGYSGVDQINCVLPNSLAGSGRSPCSSPPPTSRPTRSRWIFSNRITTAGERSRSGRSSAALVSALL